MTSVNPLDGLMSCKGFVYNNCNKKITENSFIKFGNIEGHIGSHIKIECLLGISDEQGRIPPDNNILPNTNTNSPILLTIYGSFHNNSGGNGFCNFEGYYTMKGITTIVNPDNISIFVETDGNNFNYSIYLRSLYPTITLNYFVYLPNDCTWINDGNAYVSLLNINNLDPPRYYQYSLAMI